MWLLPTYNRPDLLRQTLQHCVDTGMTTPGVILVNGGDRKPYKSIPLPPNWRIIFRSENLGWAQGCQHLYERFPDEPWYGFFYDDMVPKTPEWDLRLLERLKPGGIVTAENNWHNPPRIQTAVLDGNLVREVGFITLPKTWSCFTDDFWERLGTETGLWTHAKDVVVETLNPRKGDMPMTEETTVAGYGPNNERLEADRKVYEQFCATQYDLIKARVRSKFGKKTTLNDVKLLIGTPTGDGRVAAAYMQCFVESMKVLNRLKVSVDLCVYEKCSMLPYVRSRTAAFFLKKTDCTHLLFIDADMGWPPNAIPDLLAYRKDVVAAIGVTKDRDNPRFCVKIDEEAWRQQRAMDPETGLLRAKGAGTGFMLITRECMQRMWDASGERDYGVPAEEPDLGRIHRVFEYDQTDADWGEDYTFCRRWREMGGDVWVDPTIRLLHIGQFDYTGSYAEWIREQVSERSEAA